MLKLKFKLNSLYYRFTPFGYGPVLPPDYDDMYARASVAANAVKSVYGFNSILGFYILNS